MNEIRAGAPLVVLVICAVLSAYAQAQQPPSTPDSVDSNPPQPEWVTLHGPGQGVTEPTLVPTSEPTRSECGGQRADGNVKFSFVVDENGYPRNIVFDRALASEVDLLALKLMVDARFKPGQLNGSPVAMGLDAEIRLKVCVEQTADKSGKAKLSLRLLAKPEEKFEIWRHPPAQANLPQSQWSQVSK